MLHNIDFETDFKYILLAQQIQQPILKLRIMNFHEYLTKKINMAIFISCLPLHMYHKVPTVIKSIQVMYIIKYHT